MAENKSPTGFKAIFAWREWQKLIFGQVKLPAFVLWIWGLFLLVPSVRSALQYWWDAAVYLGGNMSTMGAILTSPWFGLFLIACGIAYQIFVDESRQPALRHKAFLLSGWLAVGLVLVAVFFISIVSYINDAIGPRHLYPMQREIITHSLKQKNKAASFTVGVEYVVSCFDCDGYSLDFVEALNSASGWRAIASGSVVGISRLSISPFGVAIRTPDASHPSAAATILAAALKKAKIKFDIITSGPLRLNFPSSDFPIDTQIMISARSAR